MNKSTKMKKNKITTILILFLLASAAPAVAKDEADKGRLIVTVKYYMYNNTLPFVRVDAKNRIDKKSFPVPGLKVSVYLDSIAENHKLGNTKTDYVGNATFTVPPSLKSFWEASPKHTFICTSEATKQFEESEQEVEITRAKLLLDTINDGDARSITATLMELSGDSWAPVKEADVRLGVKRLGGVLSAGSDPTYATDESGKATAAFEREKLAGDKNGSLILMAKVEDNETYGNLVTEMKAPWGVKVSNGNEFFQERSLWAKRQKAPYWLLFLANSIIIGVWGTIIYLLYLIFKMRKLGSVNG
jgi:hypothetical protein